MALTGTDRGSGNHNTAATSVAISPTSNCTAGAMIVLCLAYDNAGSGGADPYSSISDGLGNTWTPQVAGLYDPGAASAGVTERIFTTTQNAGTILTSTVITVSFGSSTPTAKSWVIHEVSSNATGGSVTIGSSATLPGAATGTPTITTSSLTSGDMVIGMGAAESGDTWAGDADTTNGSWSTHQHNAAGTGATGMSITSQRKIVTATATQTYNPTLTSADCMLAWLQIIELITTSFDPFGNFGFFGM